MFLAYLAVQAAVPTLQQQIEVYRDLLRYDPTQSVHALAVATIAKHAPDVCAGGQERIAEFEKEYGLNDAEALVLSALCITYIDGYEARSAEIQKVLDEMKALP